MLNNRLQTLLLPLYMLLWLVLSVYMGQHHEPFADEAQGWLIARDTTFSELFFSVLRKEGHPFLWYLWLKLLLFLGLPYSKVYLASLIPQAAGVTLFLKKAPFPLWARLAFASTYFIFYQYNIVARSYSLMLFFFVLTALLWQKREKHPLAYTIVLMFLGSISVHTFLLSIGLFVLFMPQAKTKEKLLFATFVALLVCLLFPDMTTNSYIKHFTGNMFVTLVHTMSLTTCGLITAAGFYEDIFCAAFGIFYFCLLMTELLGQYKKDFAFLLLPNLLFMAAVSYKPWHAGILILIIMLILWQNHSQKISKTLLVYIILFFMVQIYWSIRAFVQEKNGAYSAAPAVHDFLKQKNISINETEFLSFNTTSLCPYDETNSCTYWDWCKYGFIKKVKPIVLPQSAKAVLTTWDRKTINKQLTSQGFVLKVFPSEHFFATRDMSTDETIYLYYKESGNE
ncbi:MAG: hypothetical protein J6B00_05020 [Alphaproteobacteria bacterium]|nr:hypothetical protein [Alphaproteobacteria bacterium]